MREQMIEEYRKRSERRLLSVRHEQFHRLACRYEEACSLCQQSGQREIAAGTARKISLARKPGGTRMGQDGTLEQAETATAGEEGSG